MTTPKHWTQTPEFQKARMVDQSLEWWMNMVAAYTVAHTEEQVRAIAQICIDEQIGVWHAVWIYRGRVGICYCANCSPGLGRVMGGGR